MPHTPPASARPRTQRLAASVVRYAHAKVSFFGDDPGYVLQKQSWSPSLMAPVVDQEGVTCPAVRGRVESDKLAMDNLPWRI